MKTHRNLIATCTVALALLTGCGGGGGAGSGIPQTSLPTTTVSPTPNPGATSGKTAKVTVTIQIPRKANSIRVAKKGQRPYYVSPNTNSFTITVNPGAISATASCAGASQTQCSTTVLAPIGSDTFTVNLYDGSNGNGNLLSSGSTTATITEGVANSVNMTFNPVISYLQLLLSTTNELTDTSDPSFAITVHAYDADNNIIVGPGSYIDANSNPVSITLTDNDTLAKFPSPLSTQFPVSAPPEPGTIGAPYTAVGDATSVVFTAAASGSSLIASATATLTFTQVIHIQPQASVTCATAHDGETVCGFSEFANGSTAVTVSVPLNTLIEFVNDDTSVRNIAGIGGGNASECAALSLAVPPCGSTTFPASTTNPQVDGGQYGTSIDTASANLWATGTLQPGATSFQFLGDEASNSGNHLYIGDATAGQLGFYNGPPVAGCASTSSCSIGTYIRVK
jgi:hypothetical protein